MSLGLLSGYGSDSENEEESPSTEASTNVINSDNSNSDNLKERLKFLSDGGVEAALTLPPPPPPPTEIPEPLPNPMRNQTKPKKKQLPPGMSKKEAKMLENALWLDIVTEDAPDDSQKP